METLVATRGACFYSFTLSLYTEEARQFIDLTDLVQEGIDSMGVTSGMVIVTSQHTTAAIVVNEHEPELHRDFDRFLAHLAPDHADYAHNLAPCAPEELPNGHSHCQALLLSASASLPLIEGRLGLGRYQRLFLVELDRARPRRVTVSILGF